MTKEEKKLFIDRTGRVFMLLGPENQNSERTVVEGINHLYSRVVKHRLIFTKYGFSRTLLTLMHHAYQNGEDGEIKILSEYYHFYPGRRNPFALVDVISKMVHFKLFSRWSKIDMQDLLRRIDMKIVELI